MRLKSVVATITMLSTGFAAAACSKGGDQGANNAGSASATGGDSLRSATASGPGGAPATSNGTASGGQTMSDAQILSAVGASNGSEIMSSQVAQRKATSSDVKQFARMMITDHTAMQKSMDSLSKAKNITPQSPPNTDSVQTAQKSLSDSLGRMSGKAFDRAYMAAQVSAHQQTLDLLNRNAGTAQDPDLKAALQQGITKVQQHLDRARTIEGKLPAAS